MRIVVCPDSFTGTLTAEQACDAIAIGWHRQRPTDVVDCVPLSDGGPGFVSAVIRGIGAARVSTRVRGPLGEWVDADWALLGTRAWIESAAACGSHLVPPAARDARRASTVGVGQLLEAAIHAGARTITIGVGGTATTDGGAGLLAALGATASGAPLDAGGDALRGLEAIDVGPALRRTSGVELRVATDVDNALLGLRGAAAVYGPQKGADDAAVLDLDRGLTVLAELCGRRADGKDPAVALGAGAGGGLGYALMLLGAVRDPGIETVMGAVGVRERVREADLVVTGEGRLDDQSLHGKVVVGVAQVAADAGKPCVVIAGEVRLGKRELAAAGIDAAYAMADMVGADRALAHPHEAAAEVAQRVARTWGGA